MAWIGGEQAQAERLGIVEEVARGVEVVHAFGDRARLARAGLRATLVGARAFVVTPEDGPWPLPWWHRRIARFVVRSQEEARRWARAGVPLGRLVVVEDLADLAAVYVEVAAMGR